MAEEVKQRGMLGQILDILFIFILAGVCVVTPVILQGTVLVGWDGNRWNAVRMGSGSHISASLAVIIVFFTVILYHSVKNYKF